MKVVHNVILNVLKPGWPPIIDLVQLDTGHQIDFGIVGMDVTDCTAQVWIVKPSGLKIYNSCSINGQRVTLEITNQMLAEAGKCTSQLKIKSEDGLVTPFDFILNVHRDISGDGLESSNEATAWEQMVEEAAGKVVNKLMPVVSTQDTDNGVKVTITADETSKSFIIEDGYTPIRGTDYWTEDDIAVINDKMQSLVIEESAKRGQLKPEFANSIDECTDTSKLYVLPDGYIYANRVFKNNNLLVLSEVSYKSRLQDDAEGIISSNEKKPCYGMDTCGIWKILCIICIISGRRRRVCGNKSIDIISISCTCSR